MKIAVIGLSESNQDAPWADPSWEKWGLAWDANALRLDRVFEIHDIREMRQRKNWPAYSERLKQFERVYVQSKTDEIPNGIPFPFHKVERNYFASSMGYLMGLAVSYMPDEIGIWGVSMRADDEYAYQRPNMEFWIGFAKGKGIKVTVHGDSDLLKFTAGDTFNPPHVQRYGWLG